MKLQTIGGCAAIVYALLVLSFLVIFGLVFPQLGLLGPSDWGDPAKNLAARTGAPITFFLFNLDFMLIGITLLLIMFALRERMEKTAPNLMRLSVIGASVCSALWSATSVIEVIGFPSILAAKDPSALRAAMAVALGLTTAGAHASGWAFFLSGCAAFKTGALPKVLACLMLLSGVLEIIEFAVMPVMPVALVLLTATGLWLGAVLLRSKKAA
jgi:hypothetical protein